MNEDSNGKFRGDDGRFVSLKEYVEFRFEVLDKALIIQAAEYDRRLSVLNGEATRIQNVQHQSVTAERFEGYVDSERTAREVALRRVDERFEDHVKRYEFRQREIDTLIAEQRGAAASVKELAADTTRRTNRNIGLMGVGISFLIVVMNLIGVL